MKTTLIALLVAFLTFSCSKGDDSFIYPDDVYDMYLVAYEGGVAVDSTQSIRVSMDNTQIYEENDYSSQGGSCWVAPCENNLNISKTPIWGNLQDTTLRGNICISGEGNVHPTVNFTDWTYQSYNGAIYNRGTVKFGTTNHLLYSVGQNKFENVEMDGGDTIYIMGETQIRNIVANGTGNVIILQNWIVIEGKTYYPGDTYKGIKLMGCPEVSKYFSDFQFRAIRQGNRGYISFKFVKQGTYRFEAVITNRETGHIQKVDMFSKTNPEGPYSFKIKF